jgi:hypothetical protein
MPSPSLFKVLSLTGQHPGHLHWQSGACWVVLEIDDRDFVEQDGFVEFRQGLVLFNGPVQQACDFLKSRGLPVPSSLSVQVAGDWTTVTTGDDGLAIAGWDSIARAGDHGLAFVKAGEAMVGYGGVAVSAFGEVAAGDSGYALAIHGPKATAGELGLAVTDESGASTVGVGGVAITDKGGTAMAGDSGLAVGRGNSTAIAGGNGIAFAWDDSGFGGTAQAGGGGVLLIRWHDGSRYRIAVGHVGEDGIKPDTPYQLNEQGEFVEVVAG